MKICPICNTPSDDVSEWDIKRMEAMGEIVNELKKIRDKIAFPNRTSPMSPTEYYIWCTVRSILFKLGEGELT